MSGFTNTMVFNNLGPFNKWKKHKRGRMQGTKATVAEEHTIFEKGIQPDREPSVKFLPWYGLLCSIIPSVLSMPILVVLQFFPMTRSPGRVLTLLPQKRNKKSLLQCLPAFVNENSLKPEVSQLRLGPADLDRK